MTSLVFQLSSYPLYLVTHDLPSNHPFITLLYQKGLHTVSIDHPTSWRHQIIQKKEATIVDISITSQKYLPIDIQGLESVWKERDHFCYFYKKLALVRYSFQSFEWNVTLLPLQQKEQDGLIPHFRTLLARLLSWGLAPYHALVLWGHFEEKEALIQGHLESEGHFFILNSKGPYTTPLYRIEKGIPSPKKLTPPELYGLFMARTTFLHPEGLPLPLRESMMLLSKYSLAKKLPVYCLKNDQRVW